MREGGCSQPPRIATGGSSPRSTENGVGATDARERVPPIAHSWRSQQVAPTAAGVGLPERSEPAGPQGAECDPPVHSRRRGRRRHDTSAWAQNYHLPTTIHQLPSTNFSIFRIVTAPAGRRPTRSRRRSRPPRPSASVLPHRPAPSGRTPRADASAAVPFLGLQR